MKNSFFKIFIDTILGMLFFFILPLASLIIVPEIVYQISGGNVDITLWAFIIYAILLSAIVITLCRLTYEK